MIRHCPRNHPAPAMPAKPSFFLFKPLIAIASLAIMYELLPIDFQYYIAPALVSYDQVYWAATEEGIGATSSPELVDNSLCVEERSHYSPGYSESF